MTEKSYDDDQRYRALREIVIARMNARFGNPLVTKATLEAEIDAAVDAWIKLNESDRPGILQEWR